MASAALLALGVGGVALLLREVGTDRVLEAAVAAGPLLPLLFLLELGVLILETASARAITGPTALLSTTRGAIAAFVAAQLLPAGRMTGELLRAAALSPELGRARAAESALSMQGVHVAVVAATALLSALVLAGSHAALAAVLAGCGAWTAIIAVLLLMAPRSARLGAWIARRVGLALERPALEGPALEGPALEGPALEGPALAIAPSRRPARALLSAAGWAIAARVAHVVQAVVLARAILGPEAGLFAGVVVESLQLISGSVGDAVPGQLGVLEGTFRAFGGALGSGTLALAVLGALVLRSTRLGLAAVLGALHPLLGALVPARTRALLT